MVFNCTPTSINPAMVSQSLIVWNRFPYKMRLCLEIERCSYIHSEVILIIEILGDHKLCDYTCDLQILKFAVFAVISFLAASTRTPTQVHATTTLGSETFGEDGGTASSDDCSRSLLVSSEDVEANAEVGELTLKIILRVKMISINLNGI